MIQVFTDSIAQVDQELDLEEKEAHHVFDVLRVKENEEIRIISNGKTYLAKAKRKPTVLIVEEIVCKSNNIEITLCASLIKQEKFEWMIQKCVELGVTRIVPFESKFSVVHIDAKKEAKKLERWNSIALAACKQSNRTTLVEITPVQTLSNLKNYRSELNVVAYEKEETKHLAHTLQQPFQSITVCIGCEGGLDRKEVDQLEEMGFVSCSLGNNILRAETAACYLLSCIEYQSHIKEA
ncbi:MAG: 16S rRNA (uracil(1498)-N(3))-methyltransferase [Firmicutes bacterium]|nr:16S rRNA (uracil(1498)-N(3))-methyltransferase [Bacillota bacterium]